MATKINLLIITALVSCLSTPSYAFNINSNVNKAGKNGNLVTLSMTTDGENTRRSFLSTSAVSLTGLVSSSFISPEISYAVTGANDGNLPDLPADAVRSYLQYRVPLQISADSYMWEIQQLISSIDDWGEVNQLFQTNNNRGQGSPNKIERDYTNVMRILGLSFPPEEAEAMRDAQFQFEKGMAKISKATKGVRRDLPVEIDPSSVLVAKEGWDEGRQALNKFFAVVNESTGLNELVLIPPAGPDQTKAYGRNKRRYFELMKKTKLCQNRGGPALSQAWGQLMISGYMQDSCGIPDLNDYFYQT